MLILMLRSLSILFTLNSPMQKSGIIVPAPLTLKYSDPDAVGAWNLRQGCAVLMRGQDEILDLNYLTCYWPESDDDDESDDEDEKDHSKEEEDEEDKEDGG